MAGPLELLAGSEADRLEPDGVAKVLAVLRAGEAVTLAVPESDGVAASLCSTTWATPVRAVPCASPTASRWCDSAPVPVGSSREPG